MLTFLDEYIRQALCVEVRDKMNSGDVLEVIHRLLLIPGQPEFIRSDNLGSDVLIIGRSGCDPIVQDPAHQLSITCGLCKHDKLLEVVNMMLSPLL